MKRPRLGLRTLLFAVALMGLIFGAWRIAVDGPRTHWILLKLRYGTVDARRSAAISGGVGQLNEPA